ncbi:type I methionyl aminopeptidase [Rarobacter incanus]
MRSAGLVVARALDEVGRHLEPGRTTMELNEIADAAIRRWGAVPSFLGYEGYPASVCVSVNDQVIHAIPGPLELQAGDVVSVDCGAVLDGWHGDAARTLIVGGGDPQDEFLVETTRRAMWIGIAALWGARRIGEVGRAIDAYITDQEASTSRQLGIVEEFVGHGIGTEMHQDPDVPNYATKRLGERIGAGMCFAIEPMITAGGGGVVTEEDGWTVRTADASRAAHWENTVAVLPDGLAVLTEADLGRTELAALGVPVASGFEAER